MEWQNCRDQKDVALYILPLTMCLTFDRIVIMKWKGWCYNNAIDVIITWVARNRFNSNINSTEK